MKMNSQNHLKHFLIMECISSQVQIKFQSGYVFRKIEIDALNKFKATSFCNLNKKVKKGIPFIGIYDDTGHPVGFGSVQHKGERGDYFDIIHCDGYIADVFVYDEYRGNGVGKEFIRYILSSPGTYRLCVRSNNTHAIKCFEKSGFKIIDKKTVLRILKEWSIPRYSI